MDSNDLNSNDGYTPSRPNDGQYYSQPPGRPQSPSRSFSGAMPGTIRPDLTGKTPGAWSLPIGNQSQGRYPEQQSQPGAMPSVAPNSAPRAGQGNAGGGYEFPSQINQGRHSVNSGQMPGDPRPPQIPGGAPNSTPRYPRQPEPAAQNDDFGSVTNLIPQADAPLSSSGVGSWSPRSGASSSSPFAPTGVTSGSRPKASPAYGAGAPASAPAASSSGANVGSANVGSKSAGQAALAKAPVFVPAGGSAVTGSSGSGQGSTTKGSTTLPNKAGRKKEDIPRSVWVLVGGVVFLFIVISAIIIDRYVIHPETIVVDNEVPIVHTEGGMPSGGYSGGGAVYDPVNGDMVNPETATFTVTVYGNTYYFASEANMNTFISDPERYIKGRVRVNVNLTPVEESESSGSEPSMNGSDPSSEGGPFGDDSGESAPKADDRSGGSDDFNPDFHDNSTGGSGGGHSGNVDTQNNGSQAPDSQDPGMSDGMTEEGAAGDVGGAENHLVPQAPNSGSGGNLQNSTSEGSEEISQPQAQ